MRTISQLVALLVVFSVTSSLSGDLERNTLRGISGFYVTVNVDNGNTTLRLRSSTIQDDVEMLLRKAHVPVFQEGQMVGDSLWNAATVHVNIDAKSDTASTHKEGPCIFVHYNLDVRQHAKLERDTSIHVPVTTWQVTGSEICPAANAGAAVRGAIEHAALALIQDIREINPLQ